MSEPSTGIEQTLDRHESAIMALDGISGVGIALRDSNPVILVMVKTLTPELEQSIPRQLDGYRVVLEEVGEIRAL